MLVTEYQVLFGFILLVQTSSAFSLRSLIQPISDALESSVVSEGESLTSRLPLRWVGIWSYNNNCVIILLFQQYHQFLPLISRHATRTKVASSPIIVCPEHLMITYGLTDDVISLSYPFQGCILAYSYRPIDDVTVEMELYATIETELTEQSYWVAVAFSDDENMVSWIWTPGTAKQFRLFSY